MFTTSALPGPLAAVERVPDIVERVRAARQPGAGRGAGRGGAGGAARAAAAAQRQHARQLRGAARYRGLWRDHAGLASSCCTLS